MRLGIFGGTFDPIHYGHLILAECCREQLQLDKVWLVPAAVPPHKRLAVLTPAAQRAEMAELAISGHPQMGVSRLEIERGGVSYTVDTLESFCQHQPGAELFLLMGGDSLGDLPTWKSPERICQLAAPVVVSRGATTGAAIDVSALAAVASPEQLARFATLRVDMPRIDISASELRRRVAAGLSIRYRTPRAVEKYIETHGLYRNGVTAPET